MFCATLFVDMMAYAKRWAVKRDMDKVGGGVRLSLSRAWDMGRARAHAAPFCSGFTSADWRLIGR